MKDPRQNNMRESLLYLGWHQKKASLLSFKDNKVFDDEGSRTVKFLEIDMKTGIFLCSCFLSILFPLQEWSLNLDRQCIHQLKYLYFQELRTEFDSQSLFQTTLRRMRSGEKDAISVTNSIKRKLIASCTDVFHCLEEEEFPATPASFLFLFKEGNSRRKTKIGRSRK